MTEDLSSSFIANCVFNAFSSYTAIMLNSAAIYAMIKSSSLPKTLKTLLLSLAVSDLGVGLIVQPLYIAMLVMLLNLNDGNNLAHYKTTSIPFLILMDLLGFASFFGVTALTVDRFLAIHLHLRYNELVTRKRVVSVVVSVWVLSAILSLIRFMVELLVPVGKDKYISWFFAPIQFICLITTAFLHCKIYLIVRRHANQIDAMQVQQEAQNEETANAARVRKSAVATFYMYLVFMGCYLPNSALFFALSAHGSNKAIRGSSLYAFTLIFLNSSLNPFIYCWNMRHIRRTIMDSLRKIFPIQNS